MIPVQVSLYTFQHVCAHSRFRFNSLVLPMSVCRSIWSGQCSWQACLNHQAPPPWGYRWFQRHGWQWNSSLSIGKDFPPSSVADCMVADEKAKYCQGPSISWKYANLRYPTRLMREHPSEGWHKSVANEGPFVRCSPCRNNCIRWSLVSGKTELNK